VGGSAENTFSVANLYLSPIFITVEGKSSMPNFSALSPPMGRGREERGRGEGSEERDSKKLRLSPDANNSYSGDARP